jgi:drug/metabolite transporter (DMT)-like permease
LGKEPSAGGAILLSGAFVFIWATGFIVAALAVGHADPLTFLCVRYVLSIAVFAGASFLLKAQWPRAPCAWRDALIAGMLIHGIYLGGVYWAIWHGMPAGLTALVTGLHPLMTAAFAIPLLKERLGARQWAGIALGLAGVGLVVAPALASVRGLPLAPLAATLVATLALALGTVWQKRSQPRMDLRVNAAIQFMGALLLTAPAVLLVEEGRFDGTPAAWSAMAWAVLVLSVGGISILLALLKRGAASRVAPLLYLAPPVAALIAWALFGEALTAVQVAGMLLAATGAYAARPK